MEFVGCAGCIVLEYCPCRNRSCLLRDFVLRVLAEPQSALEDIRAGGSALQTVWTIRVVLQTTSRHRRRDLRVAALAAGCLSDSEQALTSAIDRMYGRGMYFGVLVL